MIAITLIIAASVAIPFIASKKHPKIIWTSWGLLFFVWAFQYEMTIDWFVYTNRWKGAILGINTESREIEPIYKMIMQICEPISYFGFLILCAVFGIFVLKKYVDNYIVPKYQWIFFVTYSLGTSYFLECVNTNRQTLAIMFVMLSVYIISNYYLQTGLKKYLAISAVLIFMAFNIHRSAIIAAPMLLFPLYIKNNIDKKYLYIFLFVDIFSFFVEFGNLSLFVEGMLVRQTDFHGFEHYAADINERSKSIIEQSIYFLSMFLMIYNFDKFKNNEKPLILASIVFLSLQGYTMYNMMRVLTYYRIFYALAIPILFMRVPRHKRIENKYAICFLSIYVIYMIYRYWIDIFGPNYIGFSRFKTIFSANIWM